MLVELINFVLKSSNSLIDFNSHFLNFLSILGDFLMNDIVLGMNVLLDSLNESFPLMVLVTLLLAEDKAVKHLE